MSVTREPEALVLRCDTINCDEALSFAPRYHWSAEVVRDVTTLWYHDDAKDRDLCPDCYLIHGTGEAQPLGILNMSLEGMP